MLKFKIYRAITFLFFLISAAVYFVPWNSHQQYFSIRFVLVELIAVLFIICYSLLISIFRYFHDHIWKIFSIALFIIGNIVFNILTVAFTKPGTYLHLVIFYLPLAIAFITIRNQEIKPLATSFALVIIVMCLLKIGLPYLRNKINISPYLFFLNAVFVMPTALMVTLFHKMILISAKKPIEETIGESDLL